jgi:aldose 1-epimerase
MFYAFTSNRGLGALTWACAALVGAALAITGAAANARGSHGAKTRPQPRDRPSITSQPWGTLNGMPVNLYTLNSGHGMTVKITNYGGVVQSIWVRDRKGTRVDVALGFPTVSEYVGTYIGAIIGRYANRIANHSFTLDGKLYNLVGNSGPANVNTLHGGPEAYNTQVWRATPQLQSGSVVLKLAYTDPNGTNGFPGTVANTVTYALTRDDTLHIHYQATTDAPTVVNLTNHTFFNLHGEGSGDIYKQLIQINAKKFQPTDDVQIPVGFASVAGTPFDFRKMKPIGRDIRNASARQGKQLVIAHGYDHNFVLDGSGYRLAAIAKDPTNGIVLRVYTDQPAVQFYTANTFAGTRVGTSGHIYRQGDGFTFETQHYPDTPHHIGDPAWPSVVLRPGQTFTSNTVYQFRK